MEAWGFFFCYLLSVEIIHIFYFCLIFIILNQELCVLKDNNDNIVDSVENGFISSSKEKNREKESICQSGTVYLCVKKM